MSRKFRAVIIDDVVTYIDMTCCLERMCKKSAKHFEECITKLIKLEQEEKAEILFDKYADRWC